MKKYLLAILSLIVFSGFAISEDFKCTRDCGCKARITEDGAIKDVTFRKGDLISTEAGWVVTPDDGWLKIRTKDDKRQDEPPYAMFVNEYNIRMLEFSGHHIIVIYRGLNETGVIAQCGFLTGFTTILL